MLSKCRWKKILFLVWLFCICIFGAVIPWLYGWVRILEAIGVLKVVC